jgi:N-dimethylarginine dimethylaminohydrolase
MHLNESTRRSNKMIKKILMCPPTYFDIEYSINPYMDVANKVDKAKSHEQWSHVYGTLKGLGLEIEVMDAVPGLPDMTFIGDAGMLHNGKFLATNFRHAERQGEVEHYIRWMTEYDVPVFTVPDGIYFEGLGDIVYYGDEILFGYGQRSSAEAISYVRDVYPELTLRGELRLKDEGMYHLGLAISYLDKDTLLYYPEAFTDDSLNFLRDNFERRIECSETDAKTYFVCNNIPVGRHILMDNCTAELERALERWGYQVVKTDMSEFKKSGGSVRCLILAID